VSACGDPDAARRQILMSQLQENDEFRSVLTQTIAGRRSKVAYLEQRLSQQRSALENFRGRVKAYMMDHKLAIAAIAAGLGGAGVALDPANEFSAEARQIGGLVAVGAALYALANAEEVAQVADQLVQADAHADTLQGQIDSTLQELRSELFQLQEEERQFAAAAQRSQELRSQLAALR